MIELYPYIKSLHLIFVITWFAGLFYIVRLFVYQIEASQKPSPDKEILGGQLKLMANRLWYIITWPSAILALIFALMLLHVRPFLLDEPWMQIKLGFIVLLYIYQFKCHQIYKQLQNDVVKYSSNFMRLFNEGATIILFSVIFLVVVRHQLNWIYGVLGIVSLAVIMMVLFKIYKRYREKK
ncbi:MAG: CopD family protein [Flavobacteriaceae bacterium]|nr:CopD family protein [Flavobacteriaceae bacterium]